MNGPVHDLDEQGAVRPTVLWWGRFDPSYSRNAILRQCFEALGWCVCDFHPMVSPLGDLQARLSALPAVALLWVPCFRQRDLRAAHRHARRLGVPLVADPLISAYDKQVDERRKLAAGSARARRLMAWEARVLGFADRLVADTHGHAGYFASTFGIARERITVVPVGADESLFRPLPLPTCDTDIEVLFYGSFLPLQGPQTIVEAAAHLRSSRVHVTLLGNGPEHARCVSLTSGNPRVRFEPWIEYRKLPLRIHAAHVLLGAFGVTPKASRVIPNKVYQSLACARPVVTRRAAAYPPALLEAGDPGLTFVDAGDARALAAAIDILCEDPLALPARGQAARAVYDAWFGASHVRDALASLLASLGLPAAADR